MAEQYPVVRAGQKVTGELLASMMPRTVRKTADTTTTGTTVTADPELQITVEANAVYLVEGVVFANNTTADDDIVIDFTAPGTTDGTWGGTGRATNTVGTDQGDAKMIGTAVTASRSFGTDDAGSGAPTVVTIDGLLIMGSTAGTYSLDWAKLNNASGGTLTVYTDSWMRLTRIA